MDRALKTDGHGRLEKTGGIGEGCLPAHTVSQSRDRAGDKGCQITKPCNKEVFEQTQHEDPLLVPEQKKEVRSCGREARELI